MYRKHTNGRSLLARATLYAAFFLFLLSASQVCATENGLGWYPDGLDDFMVGALPPPGFHFLNYMLYLNVSNYADIRGPGGVKLKDINLPGGTDTPRIKGWSFVEALRFLYVTKCKVLGGDFGMHMIVPIQHLEFTKAQWAGAPGGDLFATDDTHNTTGLRDITVAPVIGWHFSKNFHALAAVDITLPGGAYSKYDVANTGNGYFTFSPIIAWSYITDGGFEVSAKMIHDINTTNKRTGYYSGQAFHSDYVVGQRIGNFNVGIVGYYFVQVEDDSYHHQLPGFDGNRGAAFSAGPAINYHYKNMFFKAKIQFDTYVKNRPETQRYWLNWIYSFK